MNRKTREARILKRAREIAKTGRHIGWYYVEAELRTQMGEPLAREVLADQQVRDELDHICIAARKLRRRQQRDKLGAWAEPIRTRHQGASAHQRRRNADGKGQD
jgi:hypothetical protein